MDGERLPRWWQIADIIIVDRTDAATVQLPAGNADALPQTRR